MLPINLTHPVGETGSYFDFFLLAQCSLYPISKQVVFCVTIPPFFGTMFPRVGNSIREPKRYLIKLQIKCRSCVRQDPVKKTERESTVDIPTGNNLTWC